MKQLKLASMNDRNISQARQGLQVPLPKQRQEDLSIQDPLEIRAKAYNNLVSLFGPARAEGFLAGQSIEDLEKININWRTVGPKLSRTTGLTKNYFDKILDRL